MIRKVICNTPLNNEYTIGLGGGVDAQFLTTIAEETGGRYEPISDANGLALQFLQLYYLISNGHPLFNTVVTVNQGSTTTVSVELPSDQSSATFAITWPQDDNLAPGANEVSLSLETPTGVVIDPDTVDPDVRHAKGATYELYVISTPEDGNWILNLEGTNVPPQGLEVDVLVITTSSSSDPTDVNLVYFQASSPASTGMFFVVGVVIAVSLSALIIRRKVKSR